MPICFPPRPSADGGEGRGEGEDRLVVLALVRIKLISKLEVFDGLRSGLAANRAQFYRDIAAGPFYGFNRPGAKLVEGVVDNWWRQGMIGGAKAHYDGIKAFSETDFTGDLKNIDVPTLVIHGDDDQIVPYKNAGMLAAKLIKDAQLKIYPGYPHGMLATPAEVINADLLAFVAS